MMTIGYIGGRNILSEQTGNFSHGIFIFNRPNSMLNAVIGYKIVSGLT